jgi:hypothetical protein
VFAVFSLRRESLNLDLGRWTPHFWGGSITPGLGGSLGHHHPWGPSVHLGCENGWRPTLGSRYGKDFSRGVICENCFVKGWAGRLAQALLDSVRLGSKDAISIWVQKPMVTSFYEFHENHKYQSKFGSNFDFQTWNWQIPVWPINRSVYQYRNAKTSRGCLASKFTQIWWIFFIFLWGTLLQLLTIHILDIRTRT